MEATLIHKDNGRPVLDVDPIDLPRLTVYGNTECTDETNPALHRLLGTFGLYNMPTALSLVWSDTRHPVMVSCDTCNEHVPAWLTFVLDCGDYTSVICGPCDEDGSL